MTKWDPDWVVAPAEILQEWMEKNGVNARLLAVACVGRRSDRLASTEATIQHVLRKRPMTRRAAAILERGTHTPASFWTALEHNYRYGLARGKRETA